MAEDESPAQSPRRFQVLALDGGGYKGMFASGVLACLEADLGIRVTDHFDLICGTSTGGIIALGLGAGLSPAQILDFYVTRGAEIFPRKRSWTHLRRAKYDPSALNAALSEIFGERTLGDSVRPLAIPAYDLTNDDVYLFRTPHAPNLRRDHRERMVDVALATSAAPTYLPAHRLRGLRLIDGGMWANNPTMVGLVEAVRTFGRPLQDVAIFSVGTTTDLIHRPSKLDGGGLIAWRNDAISVVLAGQSVAAANHARLLLGRERFLRVDPPVPAKVLKLDGVTPDQLRGRAEHVSRHICGDFEARFLGHLSTTTLED